MEKPNKIYEPMLFKDTEHQAMKESDSGKIEKNEASPTIDLANWLESFQATIQGRTEAEPGGLRRWRDRAESLGGPKLLELVEYQGGGVYTERVFREMQGITLKYPVADLFMRCVRKLSETQQRSLERCIEPRQGQK